MSDDDFTGLVCFGCQFSWVFCCYWSFWSRHPQCIQCAHSTCLGCCHWSVQGWYVWPLPSSLTAVPDSESGVSPTADRLGCPRYRHCPDLHRRRGNEINSPHPHLKTPPKYDTTTLCQKHLVHLCGENSSKTVPNRCIVFWVRAALLQQNLETLLSVDFLKGGHFSHRHWIVMVSEKNWRRKIIWNWNWTWNSSLIIVALIPIGDVRSCSCRQSELSHY